MNEISQELINQIRSSVDIVDVISNYLSLTPRGKNLFGVCPFHEDTRPSMSVSKDKQIYKCFSCGATGNVFKFLMDYENISFVEAVKKCADNAGITLDVKVKTKEFESEKFQNLYDIYDGASKFYQNIINTSNGKDAKDYLNKRGLNEDIIKEFKVGLSLSDRKILTKFLVNKGFNKKDIINSGLVFEGNDGLTDMYADRIMFPLEDLRGNVVGFSGRIYNKKSDSKYINTRETDIFKKGELIYNFYRAKDEARAKGYVIVMEGFMDVIRAHSVGIKNCIAMMGTAVTKNQATVIKKMAKEIYLCFDGDAAGAHATFSCIEELGKQGIIPKVIRLEENLDPDEYIIKYGKDKFIEKLENPITITDFKLSYLKNNKDISNTEGMALYVNEAIKELSKINDEVLKEISLRKLSAESNLDIDFLRSKLSDLSVKKQDEKIIVKSDVPAKRKTKLEKAQEELLYYMCASKDAIKLYDNENLFIPDANLRLLATELSNYYHLYGDIKLADFMSYAASDQELYQILDRVLNLKVVKEEAPIEMLKEYISVIRIGVSDMQTKRLREEFDNPNTSSERKLEILKLIQELKTNKEKYYQ